MTISVKSLHISKDEAMLSLHEIYDNSPKKGEFTTNEYAAKNKISKRRASYELEAAEGRGVVKRRQAFSRSMIFWSKV